MPEITPPWVEGEKIPDERVQDIFQPPPEIPTKFYRSALVIGSRGAGKTTLLRYQKHVHDGIAAHISLATEFASITKQTGLGALAFDIPTAIEPLIIGKATALLALSITDRLLKKNVIPSSEALAGCLPQQFRPKTVVGAEWIAAARFDVAKAPLEVFEGISELGALPAYVSELGEQSEKVKGALLLLLDRADMVLAPSLMPVLELLDQSNRYIALVAMRPGHTVAVADSVVAGDHYAIVHLGVFPRSQEWIKFVEAAVQAQCKNFSTLPENIKSLILTISRDSLKTSLELTARYLSVPVQQRNDELKSSLDDLRENQLVASQKSLQKYHPNFRQMINELREEALKRYGRITGPVMISIKQRPPEGLFDTHNPLSRFIEMALRSGALCMPESHRWVPGLRPTELEIPPILLWHRQSSFWDHASLESIHLTRKENEVLQQTLGPRKPPTLFVAYRMTFEESKRFRREFEESVRSRPDLSSVKVVDGKVPAGALWAKVIRERISASKVVVGDVTGTRPDVLFELGFAYGLGKHIIPVVSGPADLSTLPEWLGATQVGHYRDQIGLMGLMSSIATHLSDPEFTRLPRQPHPIPALSVWLRELNWNKHAQDQFVNLAKKEGLKYEVISDSNITSIRRASSASLLIVSLDGTEPDALMHYICGAVCAKPKAGYGRLLARMILILEEPGYPKNSLVADSLRHCHDTVRVIASSQLKEDTERFLKNYKKWVTTNPASRRK
ncbi:nucleoside 2-deoxyribosyltransferase [bacterium]|nr:nucleoside 2-deoxyribosyltransferase [bacterium]